jgi:hypothetical protein
MNMNKRVGWIAVLGMAAVASVAASASAKTIMAGMQEQPVGASPSGISYFNGSGNGVYVQTSGYDVNGSPIDECRGARASFNGEYKTSTACTTAAAVFFKMEVRTLAGMICNSGLRAWGGPIASCNTPSFPFRRSIDDPMKPPTVNRVIGGVGRGY